MKTDRLALRVEPALKRYLAAAANFDRRSLGELLLMGAIQYAEGLRARGWKAKNAPMPRDGRRKEAAA